MVSSITTFILRNGANGGHVFSETINVRKVRFEAFETSKYSPDAYKAAFSINAIFRSQRFLVSQGNDFKSVISKVPRGDSFKSRAKNTVFY